jgi:hypothetical protein
MQCTFRTFLFDGPHANILQVTAGHVNSCSGQISKLPHNRPSLNNFMSSSYGHHCGTNYFLFVHSSWVFIVVRIIAMAMPPLITLKIILTCYRAAKLRNHKLAANLLFRFFWSVFFLLFNSGTICGLPLYARAGHTYSHKRKLSG